MHQAAMVNLITLKHHNRRDQSIVEVEIRQRKNADVSSIQRRIEWTDEPTGRGLIAEKNGQSGDWTKTHHWLHSPMI